MTSQQSGRSGSRHAPAGGNHSHTGRAHQHDHHRHHQYNPVVQPTTNVPNNYDTNQPQHYHLAGKFCPIASPATLVPNNPSRTPTIPTTTTNTTATVPHNTTTSGSPNNSGRSSSSSSASSSTTSSSCDNLRYEYDDHYFLTDPEEFIYEFFPLQPEWQLLKRPISLREFEQLPFVRSLFFRYGLYFPQENIRSVLYTDNSGATTIKIGMPNHMIPSLIFHYNLKFHPDINGDQLQQQQQQQHLVVTRQQQRHQQTNTTTNNNYTNTNGHPQQPVCVVINTNATNQAIINNSNNNMALMSQQQQLKTPPTINQTMATPKAVQLIGQDGDHFDGISLKRFVMQSVESNSIVSFRVHLPTNGQYIMDIFANSTTPKQYVTGEPMKFKSVCKFKIVAKELKTVMIPLPDCASGEYGPMKATRLFGLIPISHDNGLILANQRQLEIQFRMTRPMMDFMASLHKNGYDERKLADLIQTHVDGHIVTFYINFFEDGQYGLDIYTRDTTTTTTTSANNNNNTTQQQANNNNNIVNQTNLTGANQDIKQLLTHCCKYLINVKTSTQIMANNNHSLAALSSR